jgi:hypothetical protein
MRELVSARAVDDPTIAPVMYIPEDRPRSFPSNVEATTLARPTEIVGPPNPNRATTRNIVSKLKANARSIDDIEVIKRPAAIIFFCPMRSIVTPIGMDRGI